MKKHQIAVVTLSMLFVLSGFVMAQETPDEEALIKWASSLVQRAVLIDTHADTISAMVDGQYDLSIRHDDHHIDIPRLIEGGVNGQFFACWISPTGQKGWEIQRTLDMIDAIYRLAKKDDRFVIAYNASDIVEAKKEGKIAGVICIEGGHAINDDLSALRMFYKLGARYMTLTWMNNNNWADASGPDQSIYGNIPHHGGLTDFGKEVVREMNRLGMIVDVSHVHDDTFWDVMEVTTKPVIASHSCAWALNPHYRNIKDDMLRAIAKNGGVVGINFAPQFLSREYNDSSQSIRDEIMPKLAELEEKYKDDPETLASERRTLFRQYRGRIPRVPLSVLVDHIEHIAKVAGVDHIGLGSDFDGIGATPEKIDDATDYIWIVIELHKRGWSETDIRKMLGENFLRVLKANVGS